MKNRVPRYKNRYKMTLPDKTVQYVTLERADEPTEVGTPLNKENLLPDTTATKLGLTSAATPNDALLALLAKIQGTQTDLLKYSRIEVGSYTGTDNCGESNPNTLTFERTPQIVFILGGRPQSSDTGVGILLSGCESALTFLGSGESGILAVTWSGKTVSWYVTQMMSAGGSTYSSATEDSQLNDRYPYYYLAIS